MEERISNLSQVFPQGTTYFYGFPSGEDSRFFNNCPPKTEELVAMRPAVCAGPNVRIVTFAATVSERVWGLLRDDLGVPLVRRDQLIVLPDEIDCSVTGAERNRQVKIALSNIVPDEKLVMAQPYLDERLVLKYQINPNDVIWLNDKNNMREFVPAAHRIPELARVQNGREFAEIDAAEMSYPCVVKVSSSSAGDGVRICSTQEEFINAQGKFGKCEGTVLVQEFINWASQIDMQFVVHPGQQQRFEMLGYSNDITGEYGEYLGGIIRNKKDQPEVIGRISEVLQTRILPYFHRMGWFGVGGVDVLIDRDGNFYFIDFNCRMTANTAQTMQMNSGVLSDKSVLVFNGKIEGSIEDFKRRLLSLAQRGDGQQILNVVSLAEGDGALRIHGGVLFDQEETLKANVAKLQSFSVHADVFAKIK